MRRMRRRRNEKFVISVCFCIIGLLLGITIAITLEYISYMNSNMAVLEYKVNQYEEDLGTLTEKEQYLKSLDSQIDAMEDIINDKKGELQELQNSINTYSSYNESNNRIDKLLDSYEYVLYDTEGKRNDMTIDLIDLGDRLMTEYGLDPNLLFGIIMVESEGHAQVTNSQTGAAGLGQFIESTGEYVSSTFLHIEYDHSTTPYDPESSIVLMASYLNYLYDKYPSDTMSVIKEYCGGDDEFAVQYYYRVCDAVGYCIY